MSLLPAFELGLWNAWIFILPFLLTWLSFMAVNKEKMGEERLPEKEKKFSIIFQVTLFGSWIYSVFLPLQLGTSWFYAGLAVYLAGMIFFAAAALVFTATPKGRVVTKGVYLISRNPMYVGGFLMYIGIAIACVSWIFLLSAIVFIAIMRRLVVFEEAFCLGKFGKAYREHMNRTPRWIGITKPRKK